MLVEEVPRSFVKKNNNYSHCPLKKRPVHMLDEEVSEVKEEIEIDVVMDDIPEPENLSTKPEDLSKTAERNQQQEQEATEQRVSNESPSPIPKISSSPPLMTRPTSPNALHGHIHPVHHIHHHHHYPTKVITPPVGIAPIHPVAKKARVEVIQHDNSSSTGAVTATPAPLHFMASKAPLEPLNLNTPKMEKSGVSSSSTASMSSNSSSSSSSSSSSTSPRYQCPDCGKSYSTYSGLSKHQQFHCAAAEGQAKKSFSCKYCEKVYVSLGALKMHIRTHTLPCKCHLCGKAFSRPWLLQGHIRTHTGEKPFSCQHCNRAFADRSNLRAHLQTHSDVKKYSCTSCSKTFSRMSLLTKHQEGGCPGVTVPMGYAS
ncbi:zinc finger protein SNAI2 [Apis dorsata]|uniref:zinc finger protein SNAI2 n=1 Tax=Apis dorsata TaxID=7462 RepID=UPI0003DF4B44|nr:zinc finger protein SNAI2 [Apis dorsata]